MTKQKQYKSFDQLLLDVIDEALSKLGESGRTSIYIYLEEFFNIRKHEIPSRLNEFSDALKKILGSGAPELEVLFMKNLNAKLEATYKRPMCEFPLSEFTVPEVKFLEYMRLVRQNYKASNDDKVEIGSFN